MKTTVENKLSKVVSLNGKFYRSSGKRLFREWSHITHREELVYKEVFRVCECGKWKDVSPIRHPSLTNRLKAL